MKKVAGSIKLNLAQFRELEAFMQFSQDLDANTKKQIDSGRRLSALLNQKKNAPMPFERQIAVMYAGTRGFFDSFPPEKMTEVEEKFLSFMDREGKEVLGAIKKEKVISDALEAKMKEVIQKFVDSAG
jgi:F-type H+-transporting ATPase subunit alpha